MAGIIFFKKNNNSFISLKEALKIGIGISVIGGLIAILWKILLIKVIDPEIIQELEKIQIKQYVEESSDFTDENMNSIIKTIKKFTSPPIMILFALIEDLFLGFLISLIGGLIIQKKKDPFQ
ncbi:hypothetical protein GCM10022393_33100 [Aquimarina addita]|uniref:DUF4199 domain-containing protein n=2 Tax=Aquimarina addita TaxID=870485 RepID=A0ABP6UPS9_9FLAO